MHFNDHGDKRRRMPVVGDKDEQGIVTKVRRKRELSKEDKESDKLHIFAEGLVVPTYDVQRYKSSV